LRAISALGHANNRSVWNLGLPYPPTFVNAAYYAYGNQICEWIVNRDALQDLPGLAGSKILLSMGAGIGYA
jgi:hypothetical protein